MSLTILLKWGDPGIYELNSIHFTSSGPFTIGLYSKSILILKAARTNEYGRADMAAAHALLARLYLNAEVYTGTARWTEAVTHSKNVIEAGFDLHQNYAHLFLADNDKNNPEVIFSINYDGKSTRGYGGVIFLINCGSSSDYQTNYADKIIHYGLFTNANWNGYRLPTSGLLPRTTW